MTSSTTKLTLKLLVDTKNEKVLFAEASKPVVDFLFNILCLPLGTVVKLLHKKDMVGSLGNLYQSVENLNNNCLQTHHQTKDVLLNPSVPIGSIEISRFLPLHEEPLETSGVSNFILTAKLDNEDQEEDEDYDDDEEEEDETEESEEEEEEEDDKDNLGGDTLFYTCPNECSYDVTCDKTTLCSSCKRAMTNKIRYVGNKFDEAYISVKNGFVKDVVNFMVMDDLLIQPIPAFSGIAILNQFNNKDIGTLQEMVVELGVDEVCIALLGPYMNFVLGFALKSYRYSIVISI